MSTVIERSIFAVPRTIPVPLTARRALASAALMLATVSCGGGDDGTGPGPDPNAVSTVAITPTSANLVSLGATAQLTAEARNSTGAAIAGKTFTWASTNASVASVGPATGLVTAVANGSATITATVAGGTQGASAQVTVQQSVATIAVTPQNGLVIVGRTLQLSATARDGGGATVTGASLTWTTSNAVAATVNSSGLVTGVTRGSATISAASGTIVGTAPVNAAFESLALTRDTTLSGGKSYNSFTVPAGVTVTATGALTVSATGMVSIAGTLRGNCVALDIAGDSAVTVSGTISNVCGAGVAATGLRLAANGELVLDGAEVTSSGKITVTNNPALTRNAFPGPALGNWSALGAPHQQAGLRFARTTSTRIIYAGGPTAPPGVDGPIGTPGNEGFPIELLLEGDVVFAGNTLLSAQDGGVGGNGVAPASMDPVTTIGGKGGRGGDVALFVRGTLTFQGISNIIRAGKGGKGGDATATTLQRPGMKGATATATGGEGGEPGVIDIRAGVGNLVANDMAARIARQPGTGVGGILTVVIANTNALGIEIIPGDGGAATANGANGADATVATAAQAGGDAVAIGGKGGSTPNARLIKDDVTGPGQPVFSVNGAKGGAGNSSPGNGGDALVKPHKTGGKGGDHMAVGGDGGDPRTRNELNALMGLGGDGGDVLFMKGLGGAGWPDCGITREDGGTGGQGGHANGAVGRRGGSSVAPGAGGFAMLVGNDGRAHFDENSNGGPGGRGFPAGSGGLKGNNNVNLRGTLPAFTQPAFTDGPPGALCPPPPPPEQYFFRIGSTVPTGSVPPGDYVSDIIDAANVLVGTITFGAAGNQLFRQGDRVGWGANSFWRFILGTASVNGLPVCVNLSSIQSQSVANTTIDCYQVLAFSLCMLNSSVTLQNPSFLRFRNQAGLVLGERPLTANACFTHDPIPDGTWDVVVQGTGAGPFADMRSWAVSGARYPGTTWRIR